MPLYYYVFCRLRVKMAVCCRCDVPLTSQNEIAEALDLIKGKM